MPDANPQAYPSPLSKRPNHHSATPQGGNLKAIAQQHRSSPLGTIDPMPFSFYTVRLLCSSANQLANDPRYPNEISCVNRAANKDGFATATSGPDGLQMGYP